MTFIKAVLTVILLQVFTGHDYTEALCYSSGSMGTGQCSVVQCNIVWCSAVQYSAV